MQSKLIEQLSDTPAIVIGHDWGGFTAWELALRYPQIVSKLIIVNCAHPDLIKTLVAREPQQQESSKYMLAFRSERGEELLSRDDFAGFRANILQPGLQAGHLNDEDVEMYLIAWHQPGALIGGLNYYRANRSGPPTPEQPSITPQDRIKLGLKSRQWCYGVKKIRIFTGKFGFAARIC